MRRGLKIVASVAALAITTMGVAQAAFVEGIVGDVKVDFGQGFVPVKSAASLKPGDRVMIGPNSSAQIQYPGGCFVNVPVGKVVTVGAENTCSIANQVTDGGAAQGGLGAPHAIAGGVIIVGGAALLIASKKNSHSP